MTATHYNPFCSGYTSSCGQLISPEDADTGNELLEKVTCEACLSMIRYCPEVKNPEWAAVFPGYMARVWDFLNGRLRCDVRISVDKQKNEYPIKIWRPEMPLIVTPDGRFLSTKGPPLMCLKDIRELKKTYIISNKCLDTVNIRKRNKGRVFEVRLEEKGE